MRWLRVLLAALAVVVVLGGMVVLAARHPGSLGGTPRHTGIAHDEQATEDLAREVWESMTLDQRIGQLLMVPLHAGEDTATVTSLIRDSGVGSVLYLGAGWHDVEPIGEVSAALQQATGRVHLFVATDQEGGSVQRLTGDGFSVIPPATEQGVWGYDQLKDNAARWARELQAAGVNLDLAPVVDTVDIERSENRPIGALNRDFGSDPDSNAAHAKAFIEGMQRYQVATAVKHFPGLGRIHGNTDFTATDIDDAVTTVDDAAVGAFRQVLEAEPTMVMVSLAVYDAIDPEQTAAFSTHVIGDLLRDRLGWDGVVISDALNAAAVAAVPEAFRVVHFIGAGGDLAIMPSAKAAADSIYGLRLIAETDPGFREQVDKASLRVLRAKAAYGLIAATADETAGE